jgi:hypothetical protein
MQFAVVVMDGSHRRVMELGEKPMRFGCIAAYVDVALPGPTVATGLFEIRWNAEHNCHEVEVYPCVHPPSLNGNALSSEGECRDLFVADVITFDTLRIEYISKTPSSETKE